MSIHQIGTFKTYAVHRMATGGNLVCDRNGSHVTFSEYDRYCSEAGRQPALSKNCEVNKSQVL